MKPIRQSEKDGKITYHYSFKALRWFITQGRLTGDVGYIKITKEGLYNTFRGYGTIENPSKYLLTISIRDYPLFDEYPQTQSMVSYEYKILDFSKNK